MKKKRPFRKITSKQLQGWTKGGEPFLLIDTLTRDHYASWHLPGAKNACVFEVTFLRQVEALVSEKRERIVLYGFSSRSRDAVTAAEKLAGIGYENLFVLEGGLESWRKSGLKIEGGARRKQDRVTSAAKVKNGRYRVDVERSTLEWAGRNANVRHHGTVRLAYGELNVAGGKTTGYFEIDMKTINNINLQGDEWQPVLISHLESDDFFFVDKFPKAFFTIDAAEPIRGATLTEPNFRVKGTLKLRGLSRKLQFKATVGNLSEDEIMVEAHFDFDRTRWNIIYGSSRFFEHLGMHLVFDPISIQIRLIAR